VTVPDHLPSDVAAVWSELVAVHADPSRVEGPEFEAFCGQVARLRDAQGRISAEGLVVADEKGRPVPHPALAIEKQAQAEIRAWGDRFRPRRPRS
jgi:phage terminase small subunit